MVFDWLSQQGQNLRRILAPKTIRPAVQPTTPAPQTTTPARREPNTVFYGRGYTRPATQRPPAPKPAVQRVQDLRQALAPKRPENPISPAPVQARRPPAQQRTPTPRPGDELITRPLYDFGRDASNWWSAEAAPVIIKGIDSLPYLGPRTLHEFRGGQITPITAAPLTRGGTRLKPNWAGDMGHDLAKGAAVDLPKASIEYATFAVPALEMAGRTAARDPRSIPGYIGTGLALSGAGMVEAAKENPARFVGMMGAGIFIGGKMAPLKQSAGAGALRTIARVDPFFEGGMKVYTGRPGPLEAITRWQNPLEYHPTLRGSTKYELDPSVFEIPRSYYHGTSLREGGMIQTALTEGRLQVGSANPAAIPETRAAAAALERGKVAPAHAAVEHALFLGPPDTGYATFSAGAFLKVRGTVRDVPDSLVSLAKGRETIRQSGSKVPRDLQHLLSTEAYGEYLNAPKGEILVSPKPISGFEWKGIPEHEYVMKPGTKLFPVHSARSRFFQRFGMTRGSSYTIHPGTGEILEIMEFSTSPAALTPPPPVLFDIPGIRAKIPSLPKFSPLDVAPLTGHTKRRGSPSLEEMISGPAPRSRGRERPTTRPRERGVRAALEVPDRILEVTRRPTQPRSGRPSTTPRPGRQERSPVDRILEGPDMEIRSTSRPGRRDRDPLRVTPPPVRPRGGSRPDPRDSVRTGPRPGGRPGTTPRPLRGPRVTTRPTEGTGPLNQESQKKGKGRRRSKKRDPYDWIVRNPVPDIEFIFGKSAPSPAPRSRSKSTRPQPPGMNVPPGLFAPPGLPTRGTRKKGKR